MTAPPPVPAETPGETPAQTLRRAAWVARVSPNWLQERSPISEEVAEPLAAWLDDTAAAIDQRRTMVAELAPPNWVISALNFAHVVLGSSVPVPDGEGT